MMTDVQLCNKAMLAKAPGHVKRWRYYDGDHPITYLNQKFSEVFGNSAPYKKNWCQVIIDSTRNRMKVQEWANDDTATAEAMAEVWKSCLRKSATEVITAALTTGESYLVAWTRPDGTVKAYYHDPTQAHVIYDEADPDTPRVGCKRWQGSSETGKQRWFIDLYYKYSIEHYYSDTEPSEHTSWVLDAAEGNPYGRIPIFHFRTNRRTMVGELSAGVLSIQDAINKLFNDMMVTSEYSAFNQRWAIASFEDGKLPSGPGTLLKLPPAAEGEQDTSVGTFAAGSPANYLEPMGNLTNDIAALTGIPRHYFEGQGANISGEALQTMEAPLIAKVERLQEIIGDTWTEAMTFCMQLRGNAVDPAGVECIWADPHTVQPETQATTRKTNTEAGIPIINILRDEGWSEDQLDQLREDQQEAAAVTATATAAAAPATQAPTPQRVPLTPDEAAPRFEAITRTPDIAGQLASTGALARAVNRQAN
jgi:hypothetical protein